MAISMGEGAYPDIPAPNPVGEIQRKYDDGQPVGDGMKKEDYAIELVYPSDDPEANSAAIASARESLDQIFAERPNSSEQ